MNLKTKFLIVFLTLLTCRSLACLNYYVIDSSGNQHMHEDYPPSSIYIHFKYDIERLLKAEVAINTALASEKYKYISNYSASLIKLGRQKEAIPILESLLTDNPNEYEIIANLAVAYELNGENGKALEFLKKAMGINAHAHRDSEWFHLRILEAAVNIGTNKLSPHDVSILKIENEKSVSLAKQISYQLKERVPLTKSANELLSKVIEESADYFNATVSLEWAIELYAIAIGYSNDETIKNILWAKINVCRQKLVAFNEQGKKGSVSKYLLHANWKKKIRQQISDWSGYAPYYYDKPVKTTF